MSIAEPPKKLWTAEEVFAMPEDGIHREAILGELRERPMTVRNRTHSVIEATIVGCLRVWLEQRPEPRGEISCGEVGFRLRRDPYTLVGLDVAYASAELVAATPRKQTFYEGAPILAVEILSPSDQQGDVAERVNLLLEAGTVVWVINPDFRTVTVHRPGRKVEALGEDQELSGEPELPGFRVRVADLFS